MSPAASQSQRKVPKAAGRPTSPVVIEKWYAPDLRRQVEALLLVLLRARPNDDDVRQSSREVGKRTEGC